MTARLSGSRLSIAISSNIKKSAKGYRTSLRADIVKREGKECWNSTLINKWSRFMTKWTYFPVDTM